MAMGNEQPWSISWSAGLVPPSSMIPSESVFLHTSLECKSTATVENVFGLSSFSPEKAWDEVVSDIQERNDEVNQDDHEELSILDVVENFITFI